MGKLIDAIRDAICDYKPYVEKVNAAEQEAYDYAFENRTLKSKIAVAEKRIVEDRESIAEYGRIIQHIEDKNSELKRKAEGLTELDLFCEAKYQIVQKVYKDKIIINGVKMPCDLREMFTPMSSVVQQFKKRIQVSTDKLQWYRSIMSQTHAVLTWTDDGREDNYYFPCYTLTTKKGDCDDFSFVQGSVDTDLGVAFGFWDNGSGKKIGHAFSLGLINSNLHIFDAVAGNSEQFTEGGNYEINASVGTRPLSTLSS